mmetsp:Transcript_31391/g.97133  ORF Transcript_31391/g.97133 Transcript_31391/m.97133 type:complete len:179 (+) Transcript_31391:1021-1557(+)
MAALRAVVLWTAAVSRTAAARPRRLAAVAPQLNITASALFDSALFDVPRGGAVGPDLPRGGGEDGAVAHPTSLQELRLLCEKESGVAVVDFSATWCGPCQKIAPVFEKLAEGVPDALFAKVDVDEVSDASQHYGVSALPTFLIFKNGKEVARIQGADEAALRAALEKAGAPPPKNDIF